MKTLLLTAALAAATAAPALNTLKYNHIGYLPDDLKAVVYMGATPVSDLTFSLTDAAGHAVAIDSVVTQTPWAPMAAAARVYWSSATAPGPYTLTVSGADGRVIDTAALYVGADAYSRHALHEMPLYYMRQQRCGYNPVHRARCHVHDGRLVLAGDLTGTHIDVTGGWHDASDYLQYLTTSANAVYQMLFAYSQAPQVWGDSFDAAGLPGANGVPDILDEARWGLDWMLRMNPNDSLFLNQIADDRDHRFAGAPQLDNVDYGWGPGLDRPVYSCLGTPNGLGKYRNQSTGLASSVGKFASSFGLGAEVFADLDPDFAARLRAKSANAYRVARANPGNCQTASTVSPYYYEEDNWADDMELAAMARYRATDSLHYLDEAVAYGRMEPVTPWMGADSADHYQWYPFVNLGHYELARRGGRNSAEFLRNMRSGLARVADRGQGNAFRSGIPYIWCSNNLAVALVTQAMLYRDLTGDERFRELETATRDWLFGANPWGQMMVILPAGLGPSPVDPHSAMSNMADVNGRSGRDCLWGGLVDGPIYTSKFKSLWGVTLRRGSDPFAEVQNDTVVYHDDYSDYSTNEPTMDGTASLTYILSRLSAPGE